MATSYVRTETLASAVLHTPLTWARALGLVIAFSLLTALSAQIVIPLPLVPITGQVFAVLLTGALLGSRLGAVAMIAYLIEGASGLPFFFGGHGGLHHLLFSPTAGYLWAYPAAAFVVGLLAEQGWDRRYFSAVVAMALGSGVILFGGWAGLMRSMSAMDAAQVGIMPFLIGDVVKIALAAAVLPSGWAILQRRASHKK